MNIFTKVWTEAVTLWDDAAKEVDAAEAAIVKAIPALAPVIAADKQIVKQGLSTALGYVAANDAAYLKPMVVGLEGGLDAALLALTGGAALPYVPMLDGTIDQVASISIAAANTWALAKKAEMAAKAPASMPPIQG